MLCLKRLLKDLFGSQQGNKTSLFLYHRKNHLQTAEKKEYILLGVTIYLKNSQITSALNTCCEK